jgi:drug/metabolite transporter (DMT)-like permease
VLRYLPFVIITVLANAVAQIFLKQGMSGASVLNSDTPITTFIRYAFSPYVMAGVAIYVLGMSSYLVVLSKLDVNVAYPVLSLAYVLVALYAVFVLHESFSVYRGAGLVFICTGIWLLTK